jgi:hypothetical protein
MLIEAALASDFAAGKLVQQGNDKLPHFLFGQPPVRLKLGPAINLPTAVEIPNRLMRRYFAHLNSFPLNRATRFTYRPARRINAVMSDIRQGGFAPASSLGTGDGGDRKLLVYKSVARERPTGTIRSHGASGDPMQAVGWGYFGWGTIRR